MWFSTLVFAVLATRAAPQSSRREANRTLQVSPDQTAKIRTALRHAQSAGAPPVAANASRVAAAEASPVSCSLMGGLLDADLSPKCCFSVQVISQRGLGSYGLAQPCRAAWPCAADGVTPTADFEERARAELCGEPGCLGAVVAAMKGTWSVSLGASQMSRACEAGAHVAKGTAEGLLYAKQMAASVVCSQSVKDKLENAPASTANKLNCKKFAAASSKATPTDQDKKDITDLKCKCLETVPKSKLVSVFGTADCNFKKDDDEGVMEQWVACDISDTASRRRRSETSSTYMNSMCFPGEALATVRGRGQVPMASLRLGDEVLGEGAPGALEYEPVLDWIHAVRPAPSAKHWFITVTHERGVFRATPGHLVFVAAGAGREDRRASELRAGDLLFAGNESSLAPSRVVSVNEGATRLGVFAPLTRSGTVVVDGVVASNYADPAGHRLGHRLAHLMLFPVRAFHALGAPAALGRLRAALCKGLRACEEGEVGREGADELHPYLDVLMSFGVQRLLPVS